MISQIHLKFSRWIQSLFARLTLVSLGTIVLLGIVSSVYLLFEVQKSSLDALVNKANNLASELSITGSELFAHQDPTAVQRVLDRVFDANDDLRDIIVVNQAGNILAEKNLPTISEPIVAGYQTLSGLQAELSTSLTDAKIATSWDSNTFTIIQPIFDSDLYFVGKPTVIGAVMVQMSSQSLFSRRLSFMSENGIFNSLILLAMVGVITPLIYVSIIRPLHRVTYATQMIASGSFYTRMPVTGAQEFKTLATSFNQMAADLQTNQVEMRQRLNETHILYQISAIVSSTYTQEKLFDYLVNHLASLVNGTGAFIMLWDEASQKLIPQAASGSCDVPFGAIQLNPGEPTLAAKVMEMGLPIAVYDTTDSPFINAHFASQFQDKSLLGLPLIANQQKIGVIGIGETRRHRTFTESEIQLGMSAAGQIASAIANAKLFAALSKERSRLNEIINAVSEPIIVSDLHGRIQSVNQAFTKVTGWNLSDMLGKFAWSIFNVEAEGVNTFRDEINAAIRQGNVWQRELTGLRPDGSSYDAELNISSIRGSDGKIMGHVASVRDITYYKELDRMKNRFVSTVSHELRTPLSVINLYTENLLEFYERLDDKQRQGLIQDIHTETNTLHQLIEDLLSLSRLDSGKAEPRLTEFDLDELLFEAVNSARALAREKGLDFSCQLLDSRVPVLADRDQLGQVFRNLLGNAIKFTPIPGKVQLTYELTAQEIIIQISDTGIGIPAADQPRIFERFFRSELTIQEEIPGTGLGLAITKEILDRHLGSIEVQSTVGQGSTFRIMLPIQEGNR